MSSSGSVLVVDDDASVRDFIVSTLEDEGYDITSAADADEGLGAMRERSFDLVITDVHMGKRSGIELCRQAAESHPDVPVIVLTAFGNMDVAVQALRAGAADFMGKPIDVDLLARTVANHVERRQLRDEVKRLRARIEEQVAPAESSGLLGDSPAMNKVQRLIDRMARIDASVLICGESGTGKEVVARALHASGPRSAGPFVAINMTSLPEALLESQLFGHVKGAFTDAKASQSGLFLEANGGTLFLDEIGDMPLSLQPKLLRVLQERTVRPIGSKEELPFDVRLVSATHQDLERAVAEGRFREDLYFRLNVVQLDLPPLRARGNDILLLAQHFLREHGERQGVEPKGVSPEVARALLAYSWPGNVRELSNCIERAVALAELDQIVLDDLPQRVLSVAEAQGADDAEDAEEATPTMLRLDEVEREHILRVYKLCDENKVHTAQALGIDRKTLYRKLDRILTDVASPEGE
jgi:two-component system response regulator AtoC